MASNHAQDSSERTPLVSKSASSPDPRNIYDLPAHYPLSYSLGDEKAESPLYKNTKLGRSHWRSLCALFFLCLFLLIRPDTYLSKHKTARFSWLIADSTPQTIDHRVSKILKTTPLIDGHNDLAILIKALYDNHIYGDDFRVPFTKGGMRGHVDIPRLYAGGSGGAFWSAFVPCPANWSDFSRENYDYSVAFTYEQIDIINRLREEYPENFSPIVDSSTALAAFEAGQLISPIGIEGLHQIGNSVFNLRNMYALGVRYATLTHNCHNIYADAALVETGDGDVKVAEPHWGGVSEAGKELIYEMNRLGMIVDLAHVSQNTMRDVLGGNDWEGSAAPIIFSHSSAYALCPHPRNVPDDILQLVKNTNSVVMVNFAPSFVSCVAGDAPNGVPDFYPDNSTLAHVVNHITHIGDLIGYEHVGLGSDFDGIPDTPEGLDDVSKFRDLVAELLSRGVSDADAAKVVGGNVLRVWAAVDRKAKELQRSGDKPVEDDFPGFKFLASDW